MPDIDIQITDNSGEILKALEEKTKAALEGVGIQAEGYAKRSTPPTATSPNRTNSTVSLGILRNSMTHAVRGDDVYIGSNIPYAPFVELGTGIYASDGKGRKSPWSYQDRNGKWHRTKGMEPHHMLKKAASEHTEEYKRIIESIMKR
jgi:phage gpG-like protein